MKLSGLSRSHSLSHASHKCEVTDIDQRVMTSCHSTAGDYHQGRSRGRERHEHIHSLDVFNLVVYLRLSSSLLMHVHQHIQWLTGLSAQHQHQHQHLHFSPSQTRQSSENSSRMYASCVGAEPSSFVHIHLSIVDAMLLIVLQ